MDSAVLVLGKEGGLGDALLQGLAHAGIPAVRALSLSDTETAELLAQDRWRAVAVVTRDDVLALRLTLLSAHLRPDLPLWVTIFDRTITRELHHVVPAVHVISPRASSRWTSRITVSPRSVGATPAAGTACGWWTMRCGCSCGQAPGS